MPTVKGWLTQFGRWQRYGPAIIGPDPDERTLQAFDVMTLSLQLPLAKDR
jgi:hypothetical protein